MPRPPRFAPSVDEMPGAVFSPLARQLDERAGSLVPLHVGDTWLEPFAGARMEDLHERDHPGLHRYSETQGLPEIVDAIVEKVRAVRIRWQSQPGPGGSSSSTHSRIC